MLKFDRNIFFICIWSFHIQIKFHFWDLQLLQDINYYHLKFDGLLRVSFNIFFIIRMNFCTFLFAG